MIVRDKFQIGRAALLRGLDFGRRGSAALPLLAAMSLLAAIGAAAATNELSDAEIQGRQLARQLLEQYPATNFAQTGVLKIRDSKGNRSENPVKCEVITTTTNWLSVYDAMDRATNRVILKIIHHGGSPNDYYLAEAKVADECIEKAITFGGEQTMVPFAGSDFWVADLGLEFFHWPQQNVLKKETKRSRGCTVLQSTNPNPTTNGYLRVVSWIDSESGGIVQAEAYDFKNKLLKEFAPKSFKKMNGQWELQEMEIRNVQTGSHTRLEFDLKKE
ncbi:MAG: outer membrane lipoprotein-sorting protein [Verrucomicrobiota bacterium]|jgi:hypothetical protein